MPTRNPFTAFEVDLAFYLLDADDLPLQELYVGGCVEKLTMGLEYDGLPIQQHGAPYGDEIPVDERHRITLENLWLHEHEPDGTAQMPQLTPNFTRGTRFALVAVWYDNDGRYWNKRTYFGVRLTGTELGNTQHFQTTNWRAQSVAEKTGLGERPSILPENIGTVVYRKGGETTVLYTYDFDAKTFTPLKPSLLTTRATLTPEEDKFTIAFRDTPALLLDADGLHVEELIATGGTFLPTDQERIEFRIGAQRIATLGVDGVLALPDFTESGDPMLAMDMELRSASGWLGSLAIGRGYATELREPLPEST